jgi:hypothetical protein
MDKARYWWAGILTLAVIGMTGCEWDAFDSEDSWNDRLSWVNFSGVYRSPGITVIPGGGVVISPDEGLALKEEAVGVGNGIAANFAGTLTKPPLYPGTLSVTDGDESFEDAAGNGTLTGDKGGTGSINYNTGAFSVTFLSSPIAGAEVRATYIYYVGDEGQAPSPEEPEDARIIRRLTVNQQGHILDITDGSGMKYSGKMGSVQAPGGDDTGAVSGLLVANFEAEGSGIKIVGVFEGTYSAADDGIGEGVLINRIMRATWYNDAGETGNMDFTAE